jgi:threonine dehydrogenase-like Zn-dependent dehydrogenase
MSPLVVALTGPRQIELLEEPLPPLGPDQVHLRTLLSGVSAGTEMAFYRGTNPHLHKHWDPETRLFIAPRGEAAPSPPSAPSAPAAAAPSAAAAAAPAAALAYPVLTWGYEEVGTVLSVGSNVPPPLAPGVSVYGTWGHRSEAIVPATAIQDRILPTQAEPLAGIFSHIGAIALNGTLDSAVRLGETVAVFGLGVVGQLACQLLRLSGATPIGIDLLPERRAVASRLGTEHVLDPAASDIAQRIKALTEGRGADVCIEASGSTRALHEAIRSCAYNGRVVVLGFFQGEAGGLYLGEEFHHNRISLVCSQIGGQAPELQHRWDRIRLVQTFMQLAVGGSVRYADLVTHRVPMRDAAQLYQTLDEAPRSVLQGVLDFT